MKIRTTKTASGSIAVQVVRYVKRKMVLLSHIGSARNESDLNELKLKAASWIDNQTCARQSLLFDDLPISMKSKSQAIRQDDVKRAGYVDSLIKSNYKSFGCRYQILYDVVLWVIKEFALNDLKANQIGMFVDLIIARIVEPSSKFQSLICLERDFDICHQYRTLSRNLKGFSNLKEDVEAKVIKIAKKHFGFDFNLVFYDLTTLYFESFETDEIRRIGFSKDNKSSNPQVMIGLLVNKDGFPISYQVFPGNKFEGHTLMPSIISLKKKYKIKNMTLVADSAMLSDDNINLLENQKLGYIVAARTANLRMELIDKIAKQLKQQDETTIRIETQNKGTLICHFSKARYRKEKREMEKQIEKANAYLKNPSAAEIIKRCKFLKNSNSKLELNQSLIIKAKLLLGIKGYYTNKAKYLTDSQIISQYKNLWQVEKAFRISKTDLKIRPIYHYKECTIKAHLVICFAALAISKYIEIKSEKSIKSAIRTLKSAVNSVIINKITGEKITLESDENEKVNELLEKLNCHTNLS